MGGPGGLAPLVTTPTYPQKMSLCRALFVEIEVIKDFTGIDRPDIYSCTNGVSFRLYVCMHFLSSCGLGAYTALAALLTTV